MERFAAYAAHELRNELALQRVLAGVALADPAADAVALRTMGERVIDGCRRQERLLDALLALTQSRCEQLQREPLDLAPTAARVLRGHNHHQLRQIAVLKPAVTIGNPELVNSLVTNLVENAIRHNIPGGRLLLATHTATDRAILTIANSGPVIPPGELDRLVLPFERFHSHLPGAGLGLAIVQAIADAHDATFSARSRRHGGLRIDVSFPSVNARARGPARGRPSRPTRGGGRARAGRSG